MTQRVLDARDAQHARETIVISLLAPAVRRFGYVPAVDRLLPGDLVLYSGGSLASPVIATMQQTAGFAAHHARWSHAAVYLEEGLVVEAVVRGGVVQRSLYDGVHQGLMRFRRPRELSDIDRYRVALRALSRIGKGYSVSKIPNLALRMARGLWRPLQQPELKGMVICSQVYHDALVEITRGYLDKCPVDSPVTPAHLSCSDSFDDVDIGWKKVSV